MSANNILIIKKVNDRFEIHDCDIESENGLHVDTCNNLEDAIDLANEYMKEEIVEYGLKIL
jgi:hypothetical protein